MKYRFFLNYIPVMIVVSFLFIFAAEKLEDKAVMTSYQLGSNDLGEYRGKVIKDGGTAQGSGEIEKELYNGTDLRNNGMPYCIKVNKTQNVVTVYSLGDNGFYNNPVKAMVCSVGETGNTPTGVFKLGDRSEWLPLEGGVYGQYAVNITGSILFHSVPYFTQDKADLEVEEYNRLGSSVSAGCVRLSVIDARWIYDNCSKDTYVEIFESDYVGPLGKPVAAVISSGGREGNWDPTDPDRSNPYMSNIPVILGAYDREVERYSEFDISSGVTALDSTGKDVTPYMEIEGDVDLDTCGTYKVTYKVTDETAVTATATANIIVKDEEPPVLFVNQAVSSIGSYDATSVGFLEELLLKNVTAFDGKKQLDDSAVIMDYSEILEKGYGKCHIKYQAMDSEGNKSEVIVLSVDVDLEAPKISLKNKQKGVIRVSNMLNDDYMLNLVEASDKSGAVEVTISRPLAYQAGAPYTVLYIAKDKFGNVTTLNVTYQIKE